MDFTSLPALTSTADETTFNDFAFPTWTIEASVNFKSLAPLGGNAFQTFVGKNSDTSLADFYLQRNDRNGGFSVIYTGANGQEQGFDSDFLPQADTWYNVAAVYNGTDISLYVNASLVQSAPASALIVQNTPWTIGNGWNGGPDGCLRRICR